MDVMDHHSALIEGRVMVHDVHRSKDCQAHESNFEANPHKPHHPQGPIMNRITPSDPETSAKIRS